MKKYIIVLLLLGVVTVEAKPKYRIESWVYNGTTYYLPQQRVWARTNYFPLPYKHWESSSFPFQNKEEAEQIISNWKQTHKEKKEWKKSLYYNVE
jgi:hypothetical protein